MREVRESPAGDGVRWLVPGSGTVCTNLTRNRFRFHSKCDVLSQMVYVYAFCVHQTSCGLL